MSNPGPPVWKLLHDAPRIAEWSGDADEPVLPGDGRITVHTPTEPLPLPLLSRRPAAGRGVRSS